MVIIPYKSYLYCSNIRNNTHALVVKRHHKSAICEHSQTFWMERTLAVIFIANTMEIFESGASFLRRYVTVEFHVVLVC